MKLKTVELADGAQFMLRNYLLRQRFVLQETNVVAEIIKLCLLTYQNIVVNLGQKAS
ncbi:hypothetical protein [Enterococcus mundtii]|uniref:hypothetical protein n=1 Tax=Enterococcus mundtii TaxID=53346 RepID=UPI0015A541B9|nr:hypothetical protein [Enterococcus mundtii]